MLSEVGVPRRGLESARVPTHRLDSANMLLLVNFGATMRKRTRWAQSVEGELRIHSTCSRRSPYPPAKGALS